MPSSPCTDALSSHGTPLICFPCAPRSAARECRHARVGMCKWARDATRVPMHAPPHTGNAVYQGTVQYSTVQYRLPHPSITPPPQYTTNRGGGARVNVLMQPWCSSRTLSLQTVPTASTNSRTPASSALSADRTHQQPIDPATALQIGGLCAVPMNCAYCLYTVHGVCNLCSERTILHTHVCNWHVHHVCVIYMCGSHPLHLQFSLSITYAMKGSVQTSCKFYRPNQGFSPIRTRKSTKKYE